MTKSEHAEMEPKVKFILNVTFTWSVRSQNTQNIKREDSNNHSGQSHHILIHKADSRVLKLSFNFHWINPFIFLGMANESSFFILQKNEMSELLDLKLEKLFKKEENCEIIKLTKYSL